MDQLDRHHLGPRRGPTLGSGSACLLYRLLPRQQEAGDHKLGSRDSQETGVKAEGTAFWREMLDFGCVWMCFCSFVNAVRAFLFDRGLYACDDPMQICIYCFGNPHAVSAHIIRGSMICFSSNLHSLQWAISDLKLCTKSTQRKNVSKSHSYTA